MRDQVNSAKEHILVCLSTSPSNCKIIRTAAQMAVAFGGTFTAFYVRTPGADRYTREDRERLARSISLAEELGADIVTVDGDDIPYQITEFARSAQVTRLVIGRGKERFGRQSLTERLIKNAPQLEIYIIPDLDAGPSYVIERAVSAFRLPNLRYWRLMLIILAIATAIGLLVQDLGFAEENIIPVYILGSLLTALFTKNYICGATVSILSVLIFNLFFTEPRLSLSAYKVEDYVTSAIMLTASLITGGLANKLANIARQSSNTAYRTKLMLETERRLRDAESDSEMRLIVAEQLTRLLSRNIVIYGVEAGELCDGQIYHARKNDPNGDKLLSSPEMEAARCALEIRRRVGVGTDEHSDAAGAYIPIVSRGDVFAVVGIQIDAHPLEPFATGVTISILGEYAMAAESLRNAREKERIALLAKDEQLRANLLRAISHDLRTPLTSISGNAENLLSNFDSIDADSRRELLSYIYDDSLWLIGLVENLLSITRISDGRMKLRLSSELAEEVIAESIRHLERRADRHTLIVTPIDGMLLAKMDSGLISQVIINLVDNAIKYTPEGSVIKVSAHSCGERAVFEVADNGPGIPDEQKARVFEMFYTGENKVCDCRRSLGLGLALCRSIVDAHGGELKVRDNPGGGCIFSFTLPKSEVALNVEQ